MISPYTFTGPKKKGGKRSKKGHDPKRILAVAAGAIAVVLVAEVCCGAWKNSDVEGQMAETQQVVQEARDQADQDAVESTARQAAQAQAESSATDGPSADVDGEWEAISAYFTSRGQSADPVSAVRIKSEDGTATTQDESGNDVSVPIVTSYWRVGDVYVKVTDQQGQHYVDLLRETVPGVNDAATVKDASGNQASVTSNPATGARIPPAAMATLYDRLAQWASANGSPIAVDEAYVDETTVASDGDTTTFDMRGPDASRNLVVVHGSYDASTGATAFAAA